MSKSTNKNHTLAQLKRDATEGRISLELIEWYGQTGLSIPDRLRGIREVSRINSVCIYLKHPDTMIESELRLERASLVKYTGNTLIIYAPAEREPTEAEQKIWDEWMIRQKELEQKNPFSDLYWQKKRFFQDSPFCYMAGFETLHHPSKSFNPSTGKVRDKSIPGLAILKYHVHHKE